MIANALACRVTETARLGRLLRAWRTELPAYFDANSNDAPRRSTYGSRLPATPDADSATSTTTDYGYSLPTAHHLRSRVHGQKARPG